VIPISSPFCKRKLEGLAAVHKQKLVRFSKSKILLFARRLMSRAAAISDGSHRAVEAVGRQGGPLDGRLELFE
jgi:hypothetical protein